MSQAKFKAEIGAIAVGTSKVKIVLAMSKKDFFKNAEFFEDTSEEIHVSLGDPQMTFDDIAKDQGLKPGGIGGVSYNVAPSGTVENVKKDDDNQAELFDQPAAEFGVEVEGKDAADGEDLEDSTEASTEEAIESGDFEDEIGFGEDPDGVEQEETELGDLQDEKTEEPSELETAQVDKDSIEEYILKERPSFPDLPYDFPNLLEGKREGNTWIQLANYLGIPSTQLQRAWSEYKKRVRGLMGAA